MAVPEQTPYIEHTGNGITTSFALGFQCETKDHLIVLVDEIEPPIASWSLVDGNVVFTTAPAAGKKITLQRNTPFGRTTNYQSFNNSFRPQTVNIDFDRIWWKLQELGVADWLMKLYVDRLHQQQEQEISDLKDYVDDRDDELRAYLMEEIRKQGVALDQLDDYYNYLMQRLAQIAVDKGWDASFVVDASGKTQQEINDARVVVVDSIADLLALPEGQRKEGLRYLVKGYHAGSDVGGGEFYWDGTMPKSSHNGFTVIDPDAVWDGSAQGLASFFLSANQGTGCFLLVRQEHYSVDQCGALGDGVTNDAVALNQAIKYSVNLTFRTAATYAIRSEVVAPTGVSDISIEGNGAEIKRMTGYTSKRMLVFEKNRNLKVSNLRLNGNAPTVLGTCEAITARACHGLRYDHLHVYDIREASASDERRHIVRLLQCDNAIVANSSGINCSGKIFETLIFSPSMYLDELDYYAERGGILAPIYRNCLAVDAGGVHHPEETFFAMGQTSGLVIGLEEAPAITPVIYDECVGIAGPNSRFGFRGTSSNGILDVIFKNTRIRSTGYNTIEFKPDVGGSLKIEGGQYIATRTDSAIAVIVSGRGAPVSGHIEGAEIIAEGTVGVSGDGPIRLVNTKIKGGGVTGIGVINSNLRMEGCTVEGFSTSLSLSGTCSVQDVVLVPSEGGQSLRVQQSLYTSLMFTRVRLEGQLRMDRQSGSQIRLKFDDCEFHSTVDQLQLIREYDGAGSQAYIHTSFNGCEFFGLFGNLLYVTLSGGSTCKFSMQSNEVHEQVAAACRILYGGDGPNSETSVSARFNFYGNSLAAGSGYFLVASTITPRFVGVFDPDKTATANLDTINFRG